MITDSDMKCAFTLLFGEYKDKLYKLGVPTINIEDKELLEWFKCHLKKLGDTEE